jgi:hypothetical protein
MGAPESMNAPRSWLRRLLAVRDPSRRYNCQDQASPVWEARAEDAVGLLSAASLDVPAGGALKVGDLGAGNQRLLSVLQRTLEMPIDYHPYDLHPQTEDVRRMDVRRELPDQEFDVVFCLGLLEYLSDLDAFVLGLRTICRHAVVSYVITDAPDSLGSAERRRRGWLTDLDRGGIEDLFLRHSYTRQAFALTSAGMTGLWLWETAKDDAPFPGA